MKKELNKDNIRKFVDMRGSLNLQDAMKEADRCLLCHDAPCSEGCPAGTDPGKFIRQIRFMNFKGAARTIRNNNPLGAICAAVCPYDQLCEKNCSVKALEDPINIGGLQRFAVEYADQVGMEPLVATTSKKDKVAVIGAGPAGLSCAAELAKIGYMVTIFEKDTAAGGVANWGIPSYRLNNKLLNYDLENLKNLGIKIKYGQEIKTKDEILQLKNNYQAIFVAVGFAEPYSLPILQNYTNTINFVDFLRAIKFNKNFKLNGKIVAVIGGGSVAMDVACCAKAMHAKKVYAISLEALDELPANHEEIQIAHTMHINFKTNSQIMGVEAKQNKIIGLKGTEIEWVKPHKFIPSNAKPIPGTEFSLQVDLVVTAIGARPNAIMQEFAKVDNNYATPIAGIFAGGDLVNGGASVVQAVADGKAAAQSITNYLEKGGK